MHIRATAETVGPSLPVLRALPAEALQAVGPFVFLDHVGPVKAPEHGVPAHPHAGIEVISYSLDGSIEHRDSFGHAGRIGPGGAQHITAGRGILHAETPRGGESGLMHGLQLWTRHPAALDDSVPQYCGVQADEIPETTRSGVRIRLLCGSLFGLTGPLVLAQPAILAHLVLPAGTRIVLPIEPGFEVAGYVITGEAGIAGVAASRGSLVTAGDGELSLINEGTGPADVLVLGGVPAERPLVFNGPFVFGSRAAVERAYADFRAGRMGTLDGRP